MRQPHRDKPSIRGRPDNACFRGSVRRRARRRRRLLADLALAPTMRRNAVVLADQRRVLRRLLVRQTPQKRYNLRVAELRIPCLNRHDALFCSRPEARRPPRAGLRKPVRDRCMLIHKPCRPWLQPSKQNPDEARKRKTGSTQENGMHPDTNLGLTHGSLGVLGNKLSCCSYQPNSIDTLLVDLIDPARNYRLQRGLKL